MEGSESIEMQPEMSFRNGTLTCPSRYAKPTQREGCGGEHGCAAESRERERERERERDYPFRHCVGSLRICTVSLMLRPQLKTVHKTLISPKCKRGKTGPHRTGTLLSQTHLPFLYTLSQEVT